MDFAPVLKYVSIKVDDLDYIVNYFKNLFDLKKDDFIDITKNENSNKNETHDTIELFSDEGGASLQFVELDSNKFTNPFPNLLQLGLIGIKIKTRKLTKSYASYRDKNLRGISNILVRPLFHKHFHIVAQDLLFQIIEDNSNFFAHFERKNAGVYGLIIGVKDIDKSIEFYKKVLGYDKVIIHQKQQFEDFEGIEGGENEYERVVIQQSKASDDVFSKYFGSNQIELIQVIDKEHFKIEQANVINPYRFGFYTVDNRDIIGNYIELGNLFEYPSAQKFIEITDPDGIKITCLQTNQIKVKLNFNDLKVFLKRIKNKI